MRDWFEIELAFAPRRHLDKKKNSSSYSSQGLRLSKLSFVSSGLGVYLLPVHPIPSVYLFRVPIETEWSVHQGSFIEPD